MSEPRGRDNTLRALVKHLDAIGDDEIIALNIRTAYRCSITWAPTCEPGPEAAVTSTPDHS
jgi:bisphosphoglycerate-dependent phosphoglycerate mutase